MPKIIKIDRSASEL